MASQKSIDNFSRFHLDDDTGMEFYTHKKSVDYLIPHWQPVDGLLVLMPFHHFNQGSIKPPVFHFNISAISNSNMYLDWFGHAYLSIPKVLTTIPHKTKSRNFQKVMASLLVLILRQMIAVLTGWTSYINKSSQ